MKKQLDRAYCHLTEEELDNFEFEVKPGVVKIKIKHKLSPRMDKLLKKVDIMAVGSNFWVPVGYVSKQTVSTHLKKEYPEDTFTLVSTKDRGIVTGYHINLIETKSTDNG